MQLVTRRRRSSSSSLDSLAALAMADVLLTRQQTQALAAFDGFWSSLKKGLTTIAKVAIKAGLPIVEQMIPGVAPLAAGIAKVGAFVVKSDTLKAALEKTGAAVSAVSGPLGPIALEMAASMVEQSSKARSFAQGTLDKAIGAAQTVDAAAVASGARPAGGPVGFSPLPPKMWSAGELGAALQTLSKLDAARAGMVQAIVREGIELPTALRIVGASPVTPSIDEVGHIAALAGMALEETRPF